MTPRKKHRSNHNQPKPRAANSAAPDTVPSQPADDAEETPPAEVTIENDSDDTRRRHDTYEGQSEAHVHDDRELEPERPRDDGISERRPPGRVDIERI